MGTPALVPSSFLLNSLSFYNKFVSHLTLKLNYQFVSIFLGKDRLDMDRSNKIVKYNQE